MAQVLTLDPNREPRRGIRHTSASYRPYDSTGGNLQHLSGLRPMTAEREAKALMIQKAPPLGFGTYPRRPDGGGDAA